MAAVDSGYDCIVIGAGHNGLLTAAYLARAGKKVLILERRAVIGGCSVTEELWPGYKVSTAAYVLSLLLPEIIRELKLVENGLHVLPRTPSSFTPTLSGDYLLLGSDAKFNYDQIARHNRHDAERFAEYEAWLTRVAKQLEPMLSEPAPELLPVPRNWRRRGWGKQLRELRRGMRMHQRLAQLGDDLPEALELLTGAARPILQRWFQSDVLKATLATDAVIGAFASISAPGTAYVLLHHVMGAAGGGRGVWGYVEGGMGQVAQSIWRVCEQMGVELVTEREIASIDVDSPGRAVGVTDTEGRSYRAKAVASSIDADWTFRRLLDPQQLPESFSKAVERIDYSSASTKINLAISELPDFRAMPGTEPGPQHRGTIHLCDSIDWLERAYDDAKYGKPSERPMIEITIPSSVDRSLAPEGKHVMHMFVQYTPYHLAGGKSWDDVKEAFADRCIDLLVEFAPNMRNAIEHRQVLSPVDLERTFGLTGGNIFQGAMSLNQLFSLRPIAGWSDHRTPVEGLYLCGAATHPGGGVLGACGRNAAMAMLADRIV